MALQANKPFSTWDDDMSSNTCPLTARSAWWYHDCKQCNLNGEYGNLFSWSKTDSASLKGSEMKFRPHNFHVGMSAPYSS